jgi:hypothetical protein
MSLLTVNIGDLVISSVWRYGKGREWVNDKLGIIVQIYERDVIIYDVNTGEEGVWTLAYAMEARRRYLVTNEKE